MSCPKCGGLILYDGEEDRCVNCGRRPTEPVKASASVLEKVNPLAVSDRHEVRQTMRDNEQNGRRSWTPERRAKFMATMALKRKKRKGGGTTALVSARSAGVMVAPGKVIEAEASAVGELDAAIARRREELAVLERAKAIVLGG